MIASRFFSDGVPTATRSRPRRRRRLFGAARKTRRLAFRRVALRTRLPRYFKRNAANDSSEAGEGRPTMRPRSGPVPTLRPGASKARLFPFHITPERPRGVCTLPGPRSARLTHNGCLARSQRGVPSRRSSFTRLPSTLLASQSSRTSCRIPGRYRLKIGTTPP